MEVVPPEDGERSFVRALEALAAGATPSALAFLERALKLTDNQSWHSYLGYCIAKERGQVRKGIDLCKSSLEVEPGNPAHYLNLAKVHCMAGHKAQALSVLREGMSMGGSDEIVAFLQSLGMRKSPVFSFLSRDHFLNRSLGLILSRLRLR